MTNPKTYPCLTCGKEYQTPSGLRKHVKKCKDKDNTEIKNAFNIEDGVDALYENESIDNPVRENSVQDNDREKISLENKLTNMFLNNPSINLNKPVDYNYNDTIRAMSIEELRIRIREIEYSLSTKLDRRYSDTLLKCGSVFLGGIFGIGDELEKRNSEDEFLRQSAQELLSFRCGLASLPAEIKVAGLFTTNFVDIYTTKRREVNKINKAQALIKKQQQEKLNELKKIQEESRNASKLSEDIDTDAEDEIFDGELDAFGNPTY